MAKNRTVKAGVTPRTAISVFVLGCIFFVFRSRCETRPQTMAEVHMQQPAKTPVPKKRKGDNLEVFVSKLHNLMDKHKIDEVENALKYSTKSEWRQTPEINSILGVVSWEKGRKKRARKACKRAMNAAFKYRQWNGKHAAFAAVTRVFENMKDSGGAINAARLAASHTIKDPRGAQLQRRLIVLLVKRGSCADLRESVDIVHRVLKWNIPGSETGLKNSLFEIQKRILQTCSFHALPLYVQHIIHNPELMLKADRNPNDVASKQFRQFLQLSRSGQFSQIRPTVLAPPVTSFPPVEVPKTQPTRQPNIISNNAVLQAGQRLVLTAASAGTS